MPKKKKPKSTAVNKFPVGSEIRILRPHWCAGFDGEIEGYGSELVHHDRVVGFAIVRVLRFDGTGFLIACSPEEMELRPHTS